MNLIDYYRKQSVNTELSSEERGTYHQALWSMVGELTRRFPVGFRDKRTQALWDGSEDYPCND
jgi:hypothetical protein